MDLSINPDKKEERETQIKEEIKEYNDTFGSIDMVKSYLPLFELLWYNQLPCFDVPGITSDKKDEIFLGLE